MVRFPISDWLDEHGCYAFLLQSLRPDGLCCPRGHGLPFGQAPHMREDISVPARSSPGRRRIGNGLGGGQPIIRRQRITQRPSVLEHRFERHPAAVRAVQGMGGQVMKAAMWLLVREFYSLRNLGGKALLVNTVHDAAYLDAHQDVKDQAAALIHACMEAATDFLAYWHKWAIPLPVPSDTVHGVNMGEETKFQGEQFATLTAEHRSFLRQTYMDNFVPSYFTLKDFE